MNKIYCLSSGLLWLIYLVHVAIGDRTVPLSYRNNVPLMEQTGYSATYPALRADQYVEDSLYQPQVQPASMPANFLSNIMQSFKSTLSQGRRSLGKRLEKHRVNFDSVERKIYELFMRLYKKSYKPEEIPDRMRVFFNRRKEIMESIKSFSEGKETFSMKLNKFADWLDDEIKQLTGVAIPPPEQMTPEELDVLTATETSVLDPRRPVYSGRVKRAVLNLTSDIVDEKLDDDGYGMNVGAPIPAYKDWRTSGCIPTPIDQKTCGACYAISTIETLETMKCLYQNTLSILSVQQVVDCSRVYGNYGCGGGWPTRVLEYLRDTKVVSFDTCYPFVRRQNFCRARRVLSRQECSVPASVSNNGLKYRILNSERDILYHVANTGPVITVMRASNKFLYYDRGIFDDKSCSRRKSDVDHAVVIVGYGQENGINYWLIKNSWGTEWGEGGYGKYLRGVHACSIGYWGWVLLP